MRRIVIAGCRGSGLKALEIVESLGFYDYIMFVDDDKELWNTDFYGHKVREVNALVTRVDEFEAACPIGDPFNRYSMIKRITDMGIHFPNLIHPQACVSKRAILGLGNLISQGAVIQPGARIGDFNTFNVNSVVGPLAQVGNYCTINSHVMVASEAVIEDCCYLGMGAKIKQGIHVSEETTVGANSFVNRAFPRGSTLVGNPVRILEK